MRKIIVILLAALMLLSTFACSPAQAPASEPPADESEPETVPDESRTIADSPLPISYTGEPAELTQARPSRIMVVSVDETSKIYEGLLFEQVEQAVVDNVQGAVSEGTMATENGIYTYFVSNDPDADYEQFALHIADALSTVDKLMDKYEVRVEIYRTLPFFRITSEEARKIFFDMQAADGLCVSAHPLEKDGNFISLSLTKEWIKELAERQGFADQINEIDTVSYQMAVRASINDYDINYIQPSADTAYATGPDSDIIFPVWLLDVPCNIGASPIQGVPEGAQMNWVEDFGPNFLRSNLVCSVIFGSELLQHVCDVGLVEAERQLRKADTDIFHSSTALVYTDSDGYFRVRGIHFTKDPDGKMGWYFAVFDVPVTTESGDIFADANHVPTGKVIMDTPYMNVSTTTAGTRDAIYSNAQLSEAEDFYSTAPGRNAETRMNLYTVKTIFEQHGMEYLG